VGRCIQQSEPVSSAGKEPRVLQMFRLKLGRREIGQVPCYGLVSASRELLHEWERDQQIFLISLGFKGRSYGHSVDPLNIQIIKTNEEIDNSIKQKLHGLSPRANYTDRATAACRRSDYQVLWIKGAMWSA
jgi:hypothetical protein